MSWPVLSRYLHNNESLMSIIASDERMPNCLLKYPVELEAFREAYSLVHLLLFITLDLLFCCLVTSAEFKN